MPLMLAMLPLLLTSSRPVDALVWLRPSNTVLPLPPHSTRPLPSVCCGAYRAVRITMTTTDSDKEQPPEPEMPIGEPQPEPALAGAPANPLEIARLTFVDPPKASAADSGPTMPVSSTADKIKGLGAIAAALVSPRRTPPRLARQPLLR